MPALGGGQALDGIGHEHRVLAGVALRRVVVERADGPLAQQENGEEVHDGHEAHEDVGQVPGKVEAVDGTEVDENDTGKAEHGKQHGAAVLDEAQVALGVEVVADEAREGECEDGERDDVDTPLAHRVVHGHLHERHAVETLGGSRVLHIEHEDHHRRAGADDQRVDVDGQALHEALLHGVGNARSGGGVGRGAHTGLVGVQAALDAQHDDRTGESAEDGLPVEGRGEHEAEDGRQVGDVGERGPHSNGDVDKRHDGHDNRGDDADAARTAEDDERRHDGKHDAAGNSGLVAESALARVVLKRAGRIECLQAIEAEREAQDEQHGEDDAKPAMPQALLDVVGGASAELAVLAPHLEDLGERGLDEGRGGAHERHDPHPENGTRATGGDGGGDAGDVARAHTARRGHHQRLERRDGVPALNVLLLRELGEHVLDIANLHRAGTNRVPDTREHKQRQQDVGVHEAVDIACHLDKPFVYIHSEPPLFLVG